MSIPGFNPLRGTADDVGLTYGRRGKVPPRAE